MNDEARHRLACLPRVALAGPTPLQRLDRFSAALGLPAGHEVWIKRDDVGEIGLAGNKVRKFELVLGDALAHGADTVVTTGAVQSNSARAAAAACARLGLRCVLLLTGARPTGRFGNLLLDELFGAEVHLAGPVAWDATPALLAELAEEVTAAGGKPAIAPLGCSSPIGALGLALGWLELAGQLDERSVRPVAVVHATTSGGTHAGLVAGRHLTGGGPTVVGVDAGRLYGDGTAAQHAALASEALAHVGLDVSLTAGELHLVHDQVGQGYGAPTDAGVEALRLLARSEGVLTDPVYSAKGLAHVVATARAGGFGGPVVFWHTGGYQALFDPRLADAALA